MRSTSDHFADETEIEHAFDVGIRVLDGLMRLFGEDHVAVLAAKANRPFAGLVDQRDDFLVDRARQHHFDDLDRLGVGDAQAAFELRFDAHLRQHGANLRAAAMDDDRVDARLLQKRDIGRKRLAKLGIAHGVATVFHHDGLVFITLHVGQGLSQQAGLEFALGSGHGAPRGIVRGLLSQVFDRGNNDDRISFSCVRSPLRGIIL